MPLNVYVNITFQADSAAAVEAEINKWKLPEGARVQSSSAERIVSGPVGSDGKVHPDHPPHP